MVLLSFAARELDPRLDERLSWWGRVGARHTSVQRMRTLARSFPVGVAKAWQSFAAVAASHGRASWRAHADDKSATSLRERDRAEPEQPSLVENSTLLPRLRVGFGVNAKADLLAFLIGNGSRLPPSASTMARELVYPESTTKRAARDTARAHLIQQSRGHPVVYSVDSSAWSRLLEFEDVAPSWRSWALLFPFVAHALATCPSRTVTTSRAGVSKFRGRGAIRGVHRGSVPRAALAAGRLDAGICLTAPNSTPTAAHVRTPEPGGANRIRAPSRGRSQRRRGPRRPRRSRGRGPRARRLPARACRPRGRSRACRGSPS
ncbi:MAG: hypothetical protein E2O39_07510 [Planctomycetota bacterium]|nr:MAG: hypothetical protein E2O39_07510 [Planctomycetota bacterium]